MPAHRTVLAVRHEPADPPALERAVRQALADKVSGSHLGLWLLIPEHLRLGTFELLRGWTGAGADTVAPRLALQLVHEAALCVTGVRARCSLPLKGFELANGLPFVATDQALHDLLDAHTVHDAQTLQIALGRLRHTLGHYQGRLLALDPHRTRSYSKRRMRLRKESAHGGALKMAQTFFCLDADTRQPLAFTTANPACTAATAAPALLELVQVILPADAHPLVLLDCEHHQRDLFEHVQAHTPFDLMAPLPQSKALTRDLSALAPERFTRRWAGYATAVEAYRFTGGDTEFHLLAQRAGERAGDYQYKGFVSTRADDVVYALSEAYAQRWHVEEFFNAHQALGWNRAGTQNLHIRYGQLTLGLVAQAALQLLRERLGAPYEHAEAGCLARDLPSALDGDVRVHGDTIVVTYYNAPDPERLRRHYEGLPGRLAAEGVDPHVPWLYDFMLDFRFR